MKKDAIIKLIQLDQLEEAIQQLKSLPDIDTKVLTSLVAQLNTLNKEKNLGTISFEEYAGGRGQIAAQLIDITQGHQELPPALQKSNRIRVVLISVIALVLALLGLISFLRGGNTVSAAFLAEIKEEMASKDYVFEQPAIAFAYTNPDSSGTEQEWNWISPIYVKPDIEQMRLTFDKDKNTVQVAIPKITVLDKFSVAQIESNQTSSPSKAELGGLSAQLLDEKLRSDKNLRDRCIESTVEELKRRVRKRLVEGGFHFTEVDININAVELISGQML